MTHYRKNKNGRQLFMIKGNTVLQVLNKLTHTKLQIFEDADIANDLFIDCEMYTDCTEEEFTSAYKEAFDRIALMKIV